MKNYVIVTGASGRLGKKVSDNFRKNEYGVIEIVRNRPGTKDCIKCDLSNLDNTKNLINLIKSQQKNIVGIVYCCGGLRQNNNNDINSFLRIHNENKNFNLQSFILFCKSFLNEIRKNDGFIVSTSSAGGFSNNDLCFPQYKFPLLNISLGLQHYLSTTNSGARVYCAPISSLGTSRNIPNVLPSSDLDNFAQKICDIVLRKKENKHEGIIFSDEEENHEYANCILNIKKAIDEITILERNMWGHKNNMSDQNYKKLIERKLESF